MDHTNLGLSHRDVLHGTWQVRANAYDMVINGVEATGG